MPLLRYRGASLNGKFLIGDAHMSLPKGSVGNGNHFAYAPGAGVDVRVTRRVNARVDYEYQIWPSWPAFRKGGGGLSPNGFSVGVSYALLR
jgi:opacity protein-like surface antigen